MGVEARGLAVVAAAYRQQAWVQGAGHQSGDREAARRCFLTQRVVVLDLDLPAVDWQVCFQHG